MKRKTVWVLWVLAVCLLAGCGESHEWTAPDCENSGTCLNCGETRGEPLGHNWLAATCDTAKTCAVCGLTEGEPLGHSWQEATCAAPKTCTACSLAEGEALTHTPAGPGKLVSRWLEEEQAVTRVLALNCTVCGEEVWHYGLDDLFAGSWTCDYWIQGTKTGHPEPGLTYAEFREDGTFLMMEYASSWKAKWITGAWNMVGGEKDVEATVLAGEDVYWNLRGLLRLDNGNEYAVKLLGKNTDTLELAISDVVYHFTRGRTITQQETAFYWMLPGTWEFRVGEDFETEVIYTRDAFTSVIDYRFTEDGYVYLVYTDADGVREEKLGTWQFARAYVKDGMECTEFTVNRSDRDSFRLELVNYTESQFDGKLPAGLYMKVATTEVAEYFAKAD